MNLDNYKAVKLTAIRKKGEDSNILLLSDDHKKIELACRAYNTISTLQGENELYYTTTEIAYLK